MSERIAYEKCPLCDSPNSTVIARGDCSKHPLYHASLNPVITWKACLGCNHVFTEGFYTDEICKLIYSKTNVHQQVGHDFESQRIISSRMVEKVLPYASTGNWLDVGFGNGSLLFTAHEYGFTPIGIDLRVENVDNISSFGIQAHCIDIFGLRLDSKCSVISMADVLEHVPFPKDSLLAAQGLLSEKGCLLISMPNSESMAWKILDYQNANPYWNELEHCHNFSRTRLYELLHECGFEPVRYGISERYRVCMEVVARKL